MEEGTKGFVWVCVTERDACLTAPQLVCVSFTAIISTCKLQSQIILKTTVTVITDRESVVKK